MTIRLYIYGCQTCGVNAVHVRRLKAYCLQAGIALQVINTKYDPQLLANHALYLADIDRNLDTYHPVVVDGPNITLLREWQL